jgi:hypothetical protein
MIIEAKKIDVKGGACNKTPAEFFEKKSTTKNFKTHTGRLSFSC